MARAARIYDFTLTAGGSFNLLVEGSYYRLLTSTGAIEVRRSDGSVVGPLLAGQGEKDQEFKRLTLVDKSGANNTGTIVIADGTFVDDRITGEVSVIDGELARSKAGLAYSTSAQITAVAAQFSIHELWNPAGSGKRVIVSDIASSYALQSYYQVIKTTALIIAAVGATSKSSSGAVSTARAGSTTVAALTGALVDNVLASAYLPIFRTFKQPYTLEPGSGLIIASGQPNIAQFSTMQFTEEAL